MEEKPPQFTSDFSIIIQISQYISWGFFFLGFIIPYIAKIELNATGLQIGFMTSVNGIGYIVSSLFVGMITDKVPKKILVAIGAFGRATAYIVVYIAVVLQSLTFLNLGNFTIGFMVGFFWIPLDTLISEKSAKTNRSYAFGLRSRAMGIGSMVGGILGMGTFLLFTRLTPDLKWLVYISLLFFMFGNIYAGIIFIAKIDENLVIPESVECIDAKKIQYLSKKQNDTTTRAFVIAFLLLMITIFIAGINGEIARPFIQVYVLTNLSRDALIAVLVYTPASLFAMIIAPRIGNFVDKMNINVSIVIMSAFGALITFILININNIWLFAFILILDATAATISQLLAQNLFSRISKRHRGKIIGLQSLASNTGSVIGPLIGGWSWDQYGSRSPFIISIFVELFIIPLFILAVKALKPHMAEKIDE